VPVSETGGRWIVSSHPDQFARVEPDGTAAARRRYRRHFENNVELSATFISPTSPDFDNLLTALFQALDGKRGQGPTLLADDRQIVFVKNLGLMFP
jgi:hypothetical protein